MYAAGFEPSSPSVRCRDGDVDTADSRYSVVVVAVDEIVEWSAAALLSLSAYLIAREIVANVRTTPTRAPA